MARFPIPLPPKVEVTLGAGEITVKGPLGTLTRAFGDGLSIEKDGDRLVCVAANESVNAMHGTLRALVANMVKGVTDGFSRKLTLVGVGYRAQVAGDKVNLSLGFSHPVVHQLPKGVNGAGAGADRDRAEGHRQAAGRPGGRGDPRLPPARAVQGQGRALLR